MSKFKLMTEISIHAPTRGATIVPRHSIKRRSNFNPRSHERSDWWGVVCTSTIYISIHAPTRGATAVLFQVPLSLVFQSTLPREERRVRAFIFLWIIAFQSTLPREERPNSSTSGLTSVDFNPRSHERSDICITTSPPRVTLFQSTLPREERR